VGHEEYKDTHFLQKEKKGQAFNQIAESVTEYTLAKSQMRFEKDRICCNTYNLGE
jgi:hypothetical protein